MYRDPTINPADPQPDGTDGLGLDFLDFVVQYPQSFVERWDDLIDWDARGRGEGQFFLDILRRAGVRRVLDVAAGTGYHAVRLAEAGFDVTASDGSERMLRRAERNASARECAFPLVRADWRELPAVLFDRYDAVLCLGSSFPHLFDPSDRVRALRSFRTMLRPGGLLVLDHRNFDAMRAGHYRSSGRYYYCGAQVDVKAEIVGSQLCRLRYEFSDGQTNLLEVYPIPTGDLLSLLAETGFGEVRTYGDFEPYQPDACPDFLIHVARRD